MKKQKTNQPVVETAVTEEAGAVLMIDGAKYTLDCDFNTLADHEAVAGCNLLHAVPALLLNTLSAIQLRGLLYAALQKCHSGTGLMAAGKMIRIGTMPDVYAAFKKTELLIDILKTA